MPATPVSIVEPGMERFRAIRIDILQAVIPTVSVEIILLLRRFAAAVILVLRVAHGAEAKEIIGGYSRQTFFHCGIVFLLRGGFFNELRNICKRDILEEVGSCIRPDIPKIPVSDRSGSMLGRQILSDKIVISSCFQHFNAAPDTVDQPLDKLGNLTEPSCRFSALVLNDHITVTNRDSAVSFRFVLGGLEMILFDVLWEPAFPCVHEFFFRVVIALCDFLCHIAEVLDWSSFRTKPERLDPRSGIPVQPALTVQTVHQVAFGFCYRRYSLLFQSGHFAKAS